MNLFINASSHKDGHTATLAAKVFGGLPYTTVNLVDHHIHQYGQPTADPDEFAAICAQIAQADRLVFGTPTYCGSMSGYLKTFIDRMTDVVGRDNPFEGKKTALVVSYVNTRDALAPTDHVFRVIEQYYGIKYVGSADNERQAAALSTEIR
ncbi:NAD(P)H-dependent oxidoreductase [Levilactobacillus brevis]|nr:NAD(P)H-dependent oxidoreductase [Levilactobacillus brevis]